MKITESTNRRLIISEIKVNVKLYELASIQLVVNIVLAIGHLTILAISNWSMQFDLATNFNHNLTKYQAFQPSTSIFLSKTLEGLYSQFFEFS